MRLKPGCVAEPVAGAMAGALLPKNNLKNDGGLGSQKVVVYMCLRCKYDREVVLFVNGFTALWTTSLFYELHSKGKLWDIYIYLILLIPSKPPPLSSSFDPKGSGKRFFGKIAAAR